MNLPVRRTLPYCEDRDPYLPMPVVPDPLSVLAQTDPQAATALLNRQLDLVERKMVIDRDGIRTQALVSISEQHTQGIIAMIQKNDKPNVSAKVKTRGVVGRQGFWTSDVQGVNLETTFEGRSW